MPTYTVHAPPLRNGSAADPLRFQFVRDGFHFWAFLLTPLWLLSKRLWLVFVGYLLLMAATELAFHFLKLPEGVRFAIDILLSILIGLEAGSLQRWTFTRRKWATVGIVNAENEESAERRFFTQWVEHAPAAEIPAPIVTPATPPHSRGNDIIGLFPEPGGRP
jgi:hypothetical protein